MAPNSITFPEQLAGTSATPITVSATNTGNTSLGGVTASVASPFLIQSNTCVSGVDAGAICTISFGFRPGDAGVWSTQATIGFRDAGTRLVALRGESYSVTDVEVFVTGPGSVVSADGGFRCDGGSCRVVVRNGSSLELTPSTTTGHGFGGWSLGCTGIGRCTVTPPAVRSVAAQFDRLNRAFVTSFTVPADLRQFGGGDAYCRAAAIDAGLSGPGSGSFIAFTSHDLGSGNQGLPAALRTSRGWARLDGLPVADTADDLLRGRFLNSLNVDEHGQMADLVTTWTGLRSDGGTSDDCQRWTSTAATSMGTYGLPNGAGALWTSAGAYRCDYELNLNCLETGRTAAVLPLSVPSGARRAFVSAQSVQGDLSPTLANQLCAAEAQDAGLPRASAFEALRSLSQTPALQGVSLARGPWYRVDGVLWATPAIADGGVPTPPAAPLFLTASGTMVDDVFVYTGGHPSAPAGFAANTTCNNWTTNSTTTRAVVGRALNNTSSGTFQWSAAFGWSIDSVPCNSIHRLYCIEN